MPLRRDEVRQETWHLPEGTGTDMTCCIVMTGQVAQMQWNTTVAPLFL